MVEKQGEEEVQEKTMMGNQQNRDAKRKSPEQRGLFGRLFCGF